MKITSDNPGVLILSPFYEPNTGGVETHLKDLVEYLRKEGKIQVFVLTYQPITTCARGLGFEKDDSVEIRRVPWIGYNLFHKLEAYPLLEFLYITPWLFLNTLFFLFKNSKKITVIHAQGFNAAFIGRILSPVFKKRLVVSIHAIYNLRPGSGLASFILWALKKADRILTLSSASKQELVKLGLPDKQVDVYTYWVDQSVFVPLVQGEARKRLGLQDKFTVLFAGRLIEKKGADILLQVAVELKNEVVFIFIGDGPFEEKIKKASLGNPNVLHIGRLTNKDMPLYYNAADILCVPSKYEEGFGRVIIEALSCGIPVVASNRGGIPEAVSEDVGILVEPDAESFKKAILELLGNRDKLSKLKNNCRDYSVKKFGLANAKIIVDSYESS